MICHLEEKKLREWLEHHPDATPDTRPFDIESIAINPQLTTDQIARVKSVIHAYAHVFEGHENWTTLRTSTIALNIFPIMEVVTT